MGYIFVVVVVIILIIPLTFTEEMQKNIVASYWQKEIDMVI